MAYSGWITTPQAIKLDASFIRDYHLYSEIHFLESPVNQQAQRDTFQYILDANMLGPNVSFGHFIHPDDAILKAVAAAGSGMVWNPMSNGRLASGIADIPKYRKMGIKVGMGVDGQGSSDLPDPFENMRMGLYIIRARNESATVLQPIDVLRFHTMGSAEVLGVADKVGSLEVGKFGDIIIVDPNLVERGPVIDPYAAVVLACNAMNLAKVYVGGDLLVDTYHLQKNDMSKVSREVKSTRRATTLNMGLSDLWPASFASGVGISSSRPPALLALATQVPHWPAFAEAEANEAQASPEAAERISYPRVFAGEQLKMLAFPLGGVAAGSLALGGRGQLRDWEIFNRPNKGFSPQYAFPSIWIKAGDGQPITRVLEARILPPV